MTPYYRKGLDVYERAQPAHAYVRASSADKAKRICDALNTRAKVEAELAACGWPKEWA